MPTAREISIKALQDADEERERDAELARLREENERLSGAIEVMKDVESERDGAVEALERENKRLERNLASRDIFIVEQGLWDDFVRQVDELAARAHPSGDAGG